MASVKRFSKRLKDTREENLNFTQENDQGIILQGVEYRMGIQKPTKTTQKHVDFVANSPYTKGMKQQNRLKSRRNDFYAERIRN